MYAFNGYIELCSCVCVCVVRFSTPYQHEEHSSVHRERERAGWLCRCYHHPLTRENTLCLLYLAQRWMTLTYILIGTDYCFHSYRRLYILFFDFRSIIIDVCEWCMCMWVCFCYSIQTMRRWKTIKCMFHYQFADWNTQDTHTRKKKQSSPSTIFVHKSSMNCTNFSSLYSTNTQINTTAIRFLHDNDAREKKKNHPAENVVACCRQKIN